MTDKNIIVSFGAVLEGKRAAQGGGPYGFVHL